MRIGLKFPKSLIIVFSAFVLSACGIRTSIRNPYADKTAPKAVSSLQWIDTNLSAFTFTHTAQSSLVASWTPSSSTDLDRQEVQLYIGSQCNLKSGAPKPIASITQSTHTFSGLVDGSYSFKVLSYDHKNNRSESVCSSAMSVDLTPPAVTVNTGGVIWINNTNKTAFLVNGTCTDGGAGINSSVTIKLSQGANNFVSATSPCTNGTFSNLMNLTQPTSGSFTDGTNLSVAATVADQVGNTGNSAAQAVSFDSIAPVLQITSAPNWINIANQNAYTVSGSCQESGSGFNGDVNVQLVAAGGVTLTEAGACDPATSTFSATIDASSVSDGSGLTLQAFVSDVAGNVGSSAAITRSKDTVSPVLSIISPADQAMVMGNSSVTVNFKLTEINANNTQTFAIAYNNGTTTANSTVAVTNGPLTNASFTKSIATPNSNNTSISVTINYSDLAGNPATAVTANYKTDISIPSVTALSLNTGTTTTNNNNIAVAMSASDANSKISQFCLKYAQFMSPNLPTPPSAPSASDTCWKNANPPVTNATPGQSISFTNYFYQVGFTKAGYAVYAWAKDEAGNMSAMSVAGAGTANVDKATINFDPGNPPVISALSATNLDNSSSPPTPLQLTFTSGSDLIVKWNANDVEALDPNPISIYYTTNDSSYTPFTGMTDIANNQGPGCTVPAGFSGCRKLQAPSSGYFRVRVVAKDTAGTTVQYNSELLNEPQMKIIAGNMESGLGGSALTAVFNTLYTSYNSAPPGKHRLAVSEDGKIFYNDRTNGLLWVNPSTGVVNQFIRVTGTSSADATSGTPIASATLNYVVAITMDHQNNLLIYDYDRIRKVDLSTMTITTMIGGGATTITGTDFTPTTANPAPASPLPSYAANTVKLGVGNHHYFRSMIPMPNGDLYFTTNYPGYVDRKYIASSGMVDPITMTGGQGMTNQPTYSWTVGANANLSTRGTDLAITYDPSLLNSPLGLMLKGFTYSVVGNSYNYFSRIDFNNNFLGVGPYDLNTLNATYLTTGLDGKIYGSPLYRHSIFRYDANTKTTLVGTGVQRQGEPCADGTSALTCQVNIDSYFISKASRLYFVDQGLIRTINDSNQVITLFGQYASYGNNVLAQNSRFGLIQAIKLDSSVSPKRVVVLDNYVANYRDAVIGGNTSTLTVGGFDGYGPQKFLVDPANGDLISAKDNYYLKRFTRSAGTWGTIVGGGTNEYSNAGSDGLAGNQIKFSASYNMSVLGWFGTKIIADKFSWNGAINDNCFVKMYDTANATYQQSTLIGVTGNNCIANFSFNQPLLSSVFGIMVLSNFLYEPNFEGGKFIFGRKKDAIYKAAPTGNLELLTALPSGHTATSLAHTWDATNGLTVYYCSSNRLFKWNASVNGGTATQMPWAATGVLCQTGGIELDDNAGVKSLILPVTQNGLYGIVRYTLP